MRTFLHALNTWAVAQLLHPFAFSLATIVTDGSPSFEFIPVLFFAGTIAALPSFLIAWLFLRALHFHPGAPLGKLFLWAALTPVAIFCNLFLLKALIGSQETLFEEPALYLPAIVSSWTAIALRIHQFNELFTLKTAADEDYLV